MSGGRFDEEALPPDAASFAEPDLDEEMRLGQACRVLIDSEPYQLAQKTLREAVWDSFRVTPTRDAAGLMYLRMMLRVIDDTHQLLAETAETGKLAAAQIDEMRRVAHGAHMTKGD